MELWVFSQLEPLLEQFEYLVHRLKSPNADHCD